MIEIVESNREVHTSHEFLSLDQLAQEGAIRMLRQALEEEVAAYLERHAEAKDEQGRALVVRNGHAQTRSVAVGSGVLRVQAPRVNDRRVVDGERQRFTSQILPPYLRKSRAVAELLPVLYLRGLSTGGFKPALSALFGDDAAGFSPSAITGLVSGWQSEYEAWEKRTRTLCTSGLTVCTSRCGLTMSA